MEPEAGEEPLFFDLREGVTHIIRKNEAFGKI
jgi:hypothetical protein